jgi:hypothetical protein
MRVGYPAKVAPVISVVWSAMAGLRSSCVRCPVTGNRVSDGRDGRPPALWHRLGPPIETAATTDFARETRWPRVYWQAGRWDTDASHAYIANIGDDTAYDVSVTAYDRVVGLTRSVPPCRADWMLASSELPCYLSFRVEGRPETAVDPGRSDVAVRISWRSENDDWFTQTVRADGPTPTPPLACR